MIILALPYLALAAGASPKLPLGSSLELRGNQRVGSEASGRPGDWECPSQKLAVILKLSPSRPGFSVPGAMAMMRGSAVLGAGEALVRAELLEAGNAGGEGAAFVEIDVEHLGDGGLPIPDLGDEGAVVVTVGAVAPSGVEEEAAAGDGAAGDVALVFGGVHDHPLEDAMQVGGAGNGVGGPAGLGERGEEDREQQGDDADHDERFGGVAGVFAGVWRLDGDHHPFFKGDLERFVGLGADEDAAAGEIAGDIVGAGEEVDDVEQESTGDGDRDFAGARFKKGLEFS